MLLYHILVNYGTRSREKKGAPKNSGSVRVEKVAQATFSSFARVCVQPFRPHWPLEKCKKPTHRSPVFCELMRGKANGFFALYIGFLTVRAPKNSGPCNDAFFHCLFLLTRSALRPLPPALRRQLHLDMAPYMLTAGVSHSQGIGAEHHRGVCFASGQSPGPVPLARTGHSGRR